MPQLSYWHSVEVSTGSRPTLREKEVDILVEDSVGLYQGKSKIIDRQNGRAYLTSQRLIYLDNASPKQMSLSIELADVKDVDYTPKFLRSSAKITIFFKSIKSNAKSKKPTTSRQTTWICPICSFSNEIDTKLNYSNSQFIPACQTCGVKPEANVIKDAIEKVKTDAEPIQSVPIVMAKKQQIECFTCTFLNHPSMRNCEICGSNLPKNSINETTSDEQEVFDDRIKIETEADDGLDEATTPFIKLSFHKGGDKTLFSRLEQTLEKVQWEQLTQRGNVNRNAVTVDTSELPESRGVGLHRLTLLEESRTKRNEEIINSSLDDLQTLLAKANEIKGLIESFKRLQTGDEQSQAKIVPTINHVTQSILSDPTNEDQKRLYLQEISRQLSEFLITDKTLDQEGGIISLMDLYALYNRGRVGMNLISPGELYEACSYFCTLKLPLILKRINKVLVVQDMKFENNDKLVSDIRKFIEIYGDEDPFQYKSCNILRASEYFNWSLTITEQVFTSALELGVLCVDQRVTGKSYYLNELDMYADPQAVESVRTTTEYHSDLQEKETEPTAPDLQIDEEEKPSAPVPDQTSMQDTTASPSVFDQLPTLSALSAPNLLPQVAQQKVTSRTLADLEGLMF